eukprot:TRINITY_DN5950_c0_g1_i5.p1 TRINITY_DN5950_c0_g1~~TRINITY_DN5950_c0_g1_i5.p1  ORF type:complete len:117 (-),score=26.70 TRINITY_DN5950_c0_g1_i5:110-460(-)
MLYESVDDEFKMMVCAAYGDVAGVQQFKEGLGQQMQNAAAAVSRSDVNALMVARANRQSPEICRTLVQLFPEFKHAKTQHVWIWRQARHAKCSETVYLPLLSLSMIEEASCSLSLH